MKTDTTVQERLQRILSKTSEAASECGELLAARVQARKEYDEALAEHGLTLAFVNDPRERPLHEADAKLESLGLEVKVLLAEARSWLAVNAADDALARFEALPLNEGYLSKAFLLDLHAFMQRFDPSSTESAAEAGSSQEKQRLGEAVRERMDELGWVAEDLAGKAKVSDRAARAWLKGEQTARPSNRRKYADALGLPLEIVPRRMPAPKAS